MQYRQGVFGVLNLDEMEDEPLILLDGGVEQRYREPYDYYNGDRKEYGGYLFQYTLKGSGCFWRNEQPYEVSEGRGFLVRFPEESRYWLPPQAKEPWEFLYLHFDGAAAEAFAKKLHSLCPGLIELEAESPPVRMALNLQQRLTGNEQLEHYEGGEFLYRFLCALLREAEQRRIPEKNNLTGKAAEYMKNRYRTIQGIEEVAGWLKVTPEHLARSFRKEQGLSPSEYLTRQKIQAAANELLSTDKSIERIARENGFSNGNYFAKVFRRYTGVSPGTYRSR